MDTDRQALPERANAADLLAAPLPGLLPGLLAVRQFRLPYPGQPH